ncbi:MAG: carbamoyltransferase HypF [Acidobacteria bacterium]|nr:MAG: carbamoyltransferase HypF [Acidobacteriota bacterium]
MGRLPGRPPRSQTRSNPLILRLRLSCKGAVQGVGFRPTVHRLATAAGLAGRVWNDPGGATIEIEGDETGVRTFARNLPHSLPPLARLDQMDVTEIPPVGETIFKVVASRQGRPTGAAVPPDAAICAACRRELGDPSDRRFAHPFITCTDCGPRYSLVHSLPYDRPRTSMGCFPMCPRCSDEYTDPTDRRFHAEPVCCPECGPRLWLADTEGAELAENDEALAGAARRLNGGLIVAIKGLGGFQLACRADLVDTVDRLRQCKMRPTKPFAVMVANLKAARELVELQEADEDLLTSPRCPILLAPRREGTPIAETVAPGMEDLGILLPTTPLHLLLFRHLGNHPLVMTSGNASDEPICKGNREALDRLGAIADIFLLHNRDVVRRVDDSVARASGTTIVAAGVSPAVADGPFLVRRARGWAPEPVQMPEAAPAPVLAVGGHLQVTAAVACGDQAVLTPHIGDLDTDEARGFLREAIEHLEDLMEVRPEILVADAHPDYPSRWLAEELTERRGGRLIEVQHHLAHAASVLAEHQRFPAIGETALVLAMDGTGWGPAHSAWGGEWLILHGDLSWQRVGQLEPMTLIGGEAAVREPWRIAVAALADTEPAALYNTPMAREIGRERIEKMAQLSSGHSWPLATGAGRLFEACGALLGLATVNHFEGEAAIRLEAHAAGIPTADPWNDVPLPEHSTVLPSAALLAAAARRAADGEPTELIAAGFHATFNRLAGAVTRNIIEVSGEPTTIAATGGCLVNRRLRQGLRDEIATSLLLPTYLPPGDGSLAYGQAVLASACLARGCDPEVLLAPQRSTG